jgi:hypothetical protein
MGASPVVAIALSDVHLSLTPPIARAEEKDWLKAQETPWIEVKTLQIKYKVPILVAGDIFDKPINPPELTNWALDFLPEIYCIPGNHDLPNHAPSLERKSSFGTMVRAGKFHPVGKRPTYINELALYGTTLGKHPPRPWMKNSTDGLLLHVCLIHEYLWVNGKGYRDAPQEQRLSKVSKKFRGHDVYIFGDNHHGFHKKMKDGSFVWNCGLPIRRKSDEANIRPRVGLLRSNGEVVPHYLDTSADVMTALVPEVSRDDRFDGVLGELKAAEKSGKRLDYRESLRKIPCGKRTRKVLLESIE